MALFWTFDPETGELKEGVAHAHNAEGKDPYGPLASGLLIRVPSTGDTELIPFAPDSGPLIQHRGDKTPMFVHAAFGSFHDRQFRRSGERRVEYDALFADVPRPGETVLIAVPLERGQKPPTAFRHAGFGGRSSEWAPCEARTANGNPNHAHIEHVAHVLYLLQAGALRFKTHGRDLVIGENAEGALTVKTLEEFNQPPAQRRA